MFFSKLLIRTKVVNMVSKTHDSLALNVITFLSAIRWMCRKQADLRIVVGTYQMHSLHNNIEDAELYSDIHAVLSPDEYIQLQKPILGDGSVVKVYEI